MPTLAELDYAMSHPGRYVPAIKQLGGGIVIARGEGQPFRITGDTAAIYKLDTPGFGPVALRCFLDDRIPDSTIDVYRSLSQPTTHRRFLSVPHSPIVERIAIFLEGVVLRSAELRSFSVPVVATEWLQGPTLFRAADHACRSGNIKALESMAGGWQRAIEALHASQLVHGSLSPDNALVDLQRGIVLVDYDHAWWPGLQYTQFNHTPQNYRHRRAAETPPEGRDAFPALAIYVSLRLLATAPALRERHGQPATVHDGSLLFSERDLHAPNKSDLFRELARLDDIEGRALAALLSEAARSPVDRTPPIGDVIAASRSARRQIVRQMVEREQPRTNQEPPGLSTPDPEPIPPAIEPPQPRVTPETRAQLEMAVHTGDAGTVVRLWPLLAGDSESSYIAIKANALIQRFVRAGLDETLATGSAEEIIDAVAAARRMGVAVPVKGVRAERQARDAAKVIDRVRAAAAGDQRSLLADFATIVDALPLGDGDAELRRTLMLAGQWQMLEEAIESDDDQRILRAVAPELWAEPGYLPAEALERVQLARARMHWKEETRRALRERDAETLGALMEHQPPGAMEKLTATELKRIDRLVARDRALDRLRSAMDSRSDRELVDAMNEVETTGALLPPDMDWLGIRDMIDRLSLVASIRRAALSEPRDYLRLGRLLPAAREAFGSDTPYLGAQLDIVELDRDVQRDTQRRRLLEAIATGDETAIAHAASPDPLGVVPSLPEPERRAVVKLLERLSRVDPLRASERQ